jgi:hypothetical protein
MGEHKLPRFKSKDELRVAIGVPSTGTWITDFGVSYCNMMVYFQTHRVEGYKSQVAQTVSTKGSILPKSRRIIVDYALEMEADYLLWLDCDHTFPRNMLHRLISHRKDAIGANCVTKCIPAQPTARYKPQAADDPLHGLPVYTDSDSPELEKVWRLGCGVLLVDMKVFRKIGSHVFNIYWREDVMNEQGEDWSMVEALEANGFEVWVDHPLSDQVGHVGFYNFTHEVVGSVERVQEIQTKKAGSVLQNVLTKKEARDVVPSDA